MRIAVFGRIFSDEALPYVRELFDSLQRHQAEILIFSPFAQFLKKKQISVQKLQVFNAYHDLTNIDFLFSIGGDGTFLESVTYIRDKSIPILGINTGRLGFLASTPRNNIRNDIDKLFEGSFELDERTLIQLNSDKDLFNGLNFGLNEFAILKRDTSSMIVVHAYIDGQFLNSYWADGLVIATPTGSTGYSLSCGGPVVLPSSENFVIAPVSPHNLNVRPLIVSDESVLSFTIEGRSKNFLISLDSRSKTVDATVKLEVRKADFKVKLVKLLGNYFLNTLRSKLSWGLDHRN